MSEVQGKWPPRLRLSAAVDDFQPYVAIENLWEANEFFIHPLGPKHNKTITYISKEEAEAMVRAATQNALSGALAATSLASDKGSAVRFLQEMLDAYKARAQKEQA